MKLKDIFSLNHNSKGGAKLYRKIMGKYNIPKQDSKQLVKEIRNSSEGGGVKEYYYKWKDGADKLNELFELIGIVGRVKNIIVIHEKIKGESLYPVVNDKCLIPIYGSEYKIFLQDENGNRFTKSSDFEDKQLMKPQKMLSFIEQYMKGRLSFDLYLCEFEKDYIIISSDNVKRYKNLAESSQVTEEFKKEIRIKLLRFY